MTRSTSISVIKGSQPAKYTTDHSLEVIQPRDQGTVNARADESEIMPK